MLNFKMTIEVEDKEQLVEALQEALSQVERGLSASVPLGFKIKEEPAVYNVKIESKKLENLVERVELGHFEQEDVCKMLCTLGLLSLEGYEKCVRSPERGLYSALKENLIREEE